MKYTEEDIEKIAEQEAEKVTHWTRGQIKFWKYSVKICTPIIFFCALCLADRNILISIVFCIICAFLYWSLKIHPNFEEIFEDAKTKAKEKLKNG